MRVSGPTRRVGSIRTAVELAGGLPVQSSGGCDHHRERAAGVLEFGSWGLPDPELPKDEAGREPWWFETGHDWGEGVMYPTA